MTAWWVLWALIVICLATVMTRRALREASERTRIILAATHRPDSETSWGTDNALQDECELMWATPIPTDADFDRLRQAIRDHREDEQS